MEVARSGVAGVPLLTADDDVGGCAGSAQSSVTPVSLSRADMEVARSGVTGVLLLTAEDVVGGCAGSAQSSVTPVSLSRAVMEVARSGVTGGLLLLTELCDGRNAAAAALNVMPKSAAPVLLVFAAAAHVFFAQFEGMMLLMLLQSSEKLELLLEVLKTWSLTVFHFGL